MASLTQDGHKYSEYISHLQDLLQTNGITFIMNRKFQSTSSDMRLVRLRLMERLVRWLYQETLFFVLKGKVSRTADILSLLVWNRLL